MNVYEYCSNNDNFQVGNWNQRYLILPEDSTIIFNSNLLKNASVYSIRPHCEYHEFVHWFLEFQKIIMRSDLSEVNNNIFLDFSYDPCVFSQNQIRQICEWLQDCFKKSKIWWLTGDLRYFSCHNHQIIYYPYWFLNNNVKYTPLKKQYRFGCLNRNPAVHRHQLMFDLISENLLDSTLDRYSWNFGWPGSNDHISFNQPKIENFMKLEIALNNRKYISNCFDGSPNDHSLAHSAWAAHLQLITETSPFDNGIISEKTIKGILSQSLISVVGNPYTNQFLLKLGFDINYFDCSTVEVAKNYQDLEKLKQEYYNNIDKINHNKDHFLFQTWKVNYTDYLKNYFD